MIEQPFLIKVPSRQRRMFLGVKKAIPENNAKLWEVAAYVSMMEITSQCAVCTQLEAKMQSTALILKNKLVRATQNFYPGKYKTLLRKDVKEDVNN